MKIVPYQFVIVGQSGKGKTYCFRNMDQNTTGFINMENKPLPFINNFVYYSTPNNWQEAYQKLIEYAKDDKITCVVLDSLSSYLDSVMKTARETKKGYDIYSYYSEILSQLMYIIKKYPKDIFLTAHYELVDVDGAYTEKRIKVNGKSWEGNVESQFTCVIYSEMKKSETLREYYFRLQNDGNDSAKMPPMFIEALDGSDKIPNDANELLKVVHQTLNKTIKE